MSGEDTVEIVKGVMEEARSGKSVDEYSAWSSSFGPVSFSLLLLRWRIG